MLDSVGPCCKQKEESKAKSIKEKKKIALTQLKRLEEDAKNERLEKRDEDRVYRAMNNSVLIRPIKDT